MMEIESIVMDYKAEYERMCAEMAKLEEVNKALREEAKYRENEAKIMRAQINMVELIFGGHNR